MALQRLQPVGEAGHGERREVVHGRGLLGAGAEVGQRLEPALGEVGGGAEGQDVDGDTGDDVVDAEGDGGDRVHQAADGAGEDADDDAGPRAPLVAGPGTEEGAEDHHAFEADVDHARALGPQAAETGEADRHGEGEGGGDLAGAGDVVGAGDDAYGAQGEQRPGEEQQDARQAHPPRAGGRGRGGLLSGDRGAHAGTSFFSGLSGVFGPASGPRSSGPSPPSPGPSPPVPESGPGPPGPPLPAAASSAPTMRCWDLRE